jgi:hypothetical protein
MSWAVYTVAQVKIHGIDCTGSWVGPNARMDACGKSRTTGIRSADHPAHSEFLYRLRYSGPNNNSVQFVFI